MTLAIGGICSALVSVGVARAEEPSVEAVKAAGEQFNQGRTAFKEGDFAVAADYFEQADRLAPNPKVLRLAIEARVEAGHHDRAATLSELAKRVYPDDERFADADKIIARAEKDHARVEVSCGEPCSLVVGMRLVHGAPATTWVLFLPEGSQSIRAGFDGEETASQKLEAKPGETVQLEFEVPADTASPIPTDEPEPSSEGDEFATVLDPFGSEPPPERPADEPKAEGGGLSPTWFWIGAGTTVALAGVSTWSALDTASNPGPDAVRAGCVGQGEECPLYQQGLQSQSRTNLLWGVTGGVAAVTVVLLVLTDWGPPDTKPGEYSDDLALAPWWSPGGRDAPTVLGAAATGRF